jgi:tetratricopeptide (TPR) repeat protein
METTSPAQLLELAIAKVSDGKPEYGLVFALKAVNLAASSGDEDQKRRALNIASYSCYLCGDFADAVDYGLQSAALARALGREDAMLNALANVTAAMSDIGFREETVDIVSRTVVRYANREDCQNDLQILLTNAANACIGMKHYAEAIHFCGAAIEQHPEIDSEDIAYVRLVNELNWFTAAVSLDQPTAVDTRLQFMREIVVAYPSVHHAYILAIANAVYLHYSERRTLAAIADLEKLLVVAKGVGTVELDTLRWLIEISKQTYDRERAAIYERAMSDHVTIKQVSRIKRAIAAIADSEAPSGRVNIATTKQWIESLLVTPFIGARHPERTEARLSRDKQTALERIAVSARVKDDLTGLSTYRIGKLASFVAAGFGYTALEARALDWAVRLYPIGSASLIATHEIHPALKLAADVAQNCNEYWDGHGDPRQLSGKEIPEAARIAAITIAYDELTHQRTLSHAEAVRAIKTESGKQFDPELVVCFLPIIERLHQQYGEHLNRYLAAGSPERAQARKARIQLNDLVPGLTLFEEV